MATRSASRIPEHASLPDRRLARRKACDLYRTSSRRCRPMGLRAVHLHLSVHARRRSSRDLPIGDPAVLAPRRTKSTLNPLLHGFVTRIHRLIAEQTATTRQGKGSRDRQLTRGDPTAGQCGFQRTGTSGPRARPHLVCLVSAPRYPADGPDTKRTRLLRRGTPEETKAPHLRGFLKRMKGLEPSTFCMASRRSSQLSYIRGAGSI